MQSTKESLEDIDAALELLKETYGIRVIVNYCKSLELLYPELSFGGRIMKAFDRLA